MEQSGKRVFKPLNSEMLRTWRPGRLFGAYLSMLSYHEHDGLFEDDMETLGHLEHALNNRLLPEKYSFCQSIGDPFQREVYFRKFLMPVSGP